MQNRRFLLAFLAGLLCAAAPPAQEELHTQLPLIRTVGTATVEIAPDRAEFWLHFTVEEESHLEAARKARETKVHALQALKDAEISPLETFVAAPAVPDANAPIVAFAMRLRFPVGRLATGTEEPVVQLAELCDRLRRLAAQLNASLQGPVLKLDNPVETERTAVMRAMENALPHAEAGAHIMTSQVASIHEVNVLEVVWNASPHYQAAQPDVERAACTAKVEVAYVLDPGNR